jgi:hypothetical protein
MLMAKSGDLQQFKLQFNCCGTSVEKVDTHVALGGITALPVSAQRSL